MSLPPSNSYKDTFRNVLRYTGQNYRFVPTYLRTRDPIAPNNASPDIKPPEQQGYYPVNSLWTNTVTSTVWLLVGITNNLANWVNISSGGGAGSVMILTNAGLVSPTGGVFDFRNNGGNVIVSTTGANTVTFNALPVLDFLDFHLVQVNADAMPVSGVINFDSDATVSITKTGANTIFFSAPGLANSFIGLRAGSNSTNVDPQIAGVFPGRILFSSASSSVTINGNAGTNTIDLNALPTLNSLTFRLVQQAMNVSPAASIVNFDSNTSILITKTSGNTMLFNVPGAINTFTTDLKNNGTPIGTVTPTGNNIQVLATDPTGEIQGLQTRSVTTTNPSDTILIEYINRTVTTLGAVKTNIYTFGSSNNSSFTFTAIFSAYRPFDGTSFGGRMTVIGSNFGGVAAINTVLESISGGVPALSVCSFDATVSGSNISINVTGRAATTLNWKVLIPTIATAP